MAFPIINLNAFILVLFRSLGYAWISANGLIIEKFLAIIYILITSFFIKNYILYFIFIPVFSLTYYLIESHKKGINFDFGIDLNKIILDLKNGSKIMLSNVLYNLMSFGSLILANKFYDKSSVSKLAISISFINLFIGVSSQISNIYFPLIANKRQKDEEIDLLKYSLIIQKVVPLLIILFLFITYLFRYLFKSFLKDEDVLNLIFLFLPIAYFEIKNQFINIIIIKLNLQLKSYLLINLISLIIGVFVIGVLHFKFGFIFSTYFLVLILSFLLRFTLLSIYCKMLTLIDVFFIALFLIYIYIFI